MVLLLLDLVILDCDGFLGTAVQFSLALFGAIRFLVDRLTHLTSTRELSFSRTCTGRGGV
jgi:hypothetical protein